MTQLQVWGAIAAIAAAFFGIFSGLLAVLFRGIRAWSSIDRKLTTIETTVANHIVTSDATHRAISESLSQDRRATDERLRWLERNLWGSTKRSGHAGTA